MPYIVVESFKGGLDRRRSDLVSAPGMLIKAENVHVTRGGEIEKRKAFVAIDTGVDTEHQNPFEGTYGMESTSEGVTVFTTSYQQVSWYNAGRWIRFLYISSTDWGVATIAHDKLYYRFGNRPANETHELDLPQLSVSDPQIQIPENCETIEISFDQPNQNSPLQNSFYVRLKGGQYSVILVCDDGLVQEGVVLDVDTKTLDYGDMMIVNIERNYSTSLSYNWGGNSATSATASRFQVYNQHSGVPFSILKGHAFDVPKDVYVDLTGGGNPNITYPSPFIRGAWTSEQGISNIAIVVSETLPTQPSDDGVRQLSIPLIWNRKTIRQRITSIYTNVTVVELDHPDKVQMTGIVFSTVYGGKSFVLAKFANGDVLPFYDGKLVGAFTDGVYREYYGGLYRFIDSIAGLMKDAFAIAQENFVGDSSIDEQIREYGVSTVETPSGTSMTITGPARKVDYTVKAYIDEPAAHSIEIVQEATAPIAARSAVASFVVAAGTTSAASCGNTQRYITASALPGISGIYITADDTDPSNGQEILGLAAGDTISWPYTGYTSPGAWDQNMALCYAIHYIVNTNTINSGISATYANYGGGWSNQDPASFFLHSTNRAGPSMVGKTTWIEFVADPSGVNRVVDLIFVSTVQVSPYDPAKFIAKMVGGTWINGQRNAVSSILSNGVELLSDIDPATMNTNPDPAQYMGDSTEQLAINIVDSINSKTNVHGHTATREDTRVLITAPAGTGSSVNRRPFYVRTDGNVILSSSKGFSGGQDEIPGVPKIVRINFTGTPNVGDKCWVMITDPARPQTPYKFGATRMAGKKGVFNFTYKGKEYIGIGSTLYFSSLNNPVKWDTYDSGSGFIDMSNNFGGRDDLTGAGVYQNSIAVFTERNCQLWFFDPDPNQNKQQQILDNTGCLAPNSVVSVGATDLFYLSYNGVRSLQSRESTDAAYANDIGSPIDEIVISILAGLTPAQRAEAKALIEPIDGRYWISIGSRLFVLSYFKGSNILAWSEYVLGFQVDEMVAFRDKVYLRAGNKIYLYGGNSGSEYDSCPVVVELPYLDANKPGTFKSVNGVDITCQGTWKVFMGFDYTNANARDEIATFTQPSFALGKIPATGIGTHIGVRLTSEHPGYSRLANVLVHYDDLHSKHEAG